MDLNKYGLNKEEKQRILQIFNLTGNQEMLNQRPNKKIFEKNNYQNIFGIKNNANTKKCIYKKDLLLEFCKHSPEFNETFQKQMLQEETSIHKCLETAFKEKNKRLIRNFLRNDIQHGNDLLKMYLIHIDKTDRKLFNDILNTVDYDHLKLNASLFRDRKMELLLYKFHRGINREKPYFKF